jgi:hypothetical protein
MPQSYGSEDSPVSDSVSNMQPGDVARLTRAGRSQRSRRLRHAFAGILAVALVIGACEGDNLFSGDSEASRPRITSISLPQLARAGDTLTVTVGAFAPRLVSTISLALSGAVTRDTTITIDPATQTASGNFKLLLPGLLTDTLITVRLIARDKVGASSEVLTRTLPTVAPPAIITIESPDSIGVGQPLNLRIRALSMRNITRLLVTLRGAIVKDSTVLVPIPANDITQNVVFSLPTFTTDTLLTITVSGVDDRGLVGTATTLTRRIGASPPRVVILSAPDSAQAGRVFDLRLNASGTRPITRMDIQLRGAIDQDIPVPVTPSSRNSTKDIAITLPDTVRDTTLVVRVTATDDANVVSAIVIHTIRIRDVSAPSVTALLSAGSVGAGSSVNVRVNASDNISLARIGFLVFDSANVRIDSVFAMVPTGRTRDSTFVYTVNSSFRPTSLRFQGLAEDRQGVRGLSSQVTLGVLDLIKPTVGIQSPVDGSTFPMNDSVLVRVRVADIAGVKSVTFGGIAMRNDTLTGASVVTKFTSKTVTFPEAPQTVMPRDTTIVRYINSVPNDSVSEGVAVIVTATDSIGNIGVDTAFISVGGPRVEIRTPANGTAVLAGSTLPVRLFARDPSSGIDSLRLDATGIAGVVPAFIVYRGLAAPDSVLRDTSIVLPAGATGTLTLTATAWNRRGILGRTAAPVILTVSTTAVTDVSKPLVRVEFLTQPTRVELNDSIGVRVTARDVGSAGLKRLGLTATLQRSDGVVVAEVVTRDTVFPSSRTGDLDRVFYIKPSSFLLTDTTHMPVDVTMQVHGFAKDTVGNCGAAVHTAFETLNCQGLVQRMSNSGVLDSFYVAQGATGAAVSSKLVAGRTVNLAANSLIADAAVDVVRSRLFLSNKSNSKVDVLDMTTNTFLCAGAAATCATSGVPVGSEPWGLFIDNTGDTLIVANSGGTNVSFVPLAGAGALVEDNVKRLRTPNAVFFDVKISTDATRSRYDVDFHDYSDRPQFIAQDMTGVILYSTKPTAAATPGTIRLVDRDPDANPATPDPEIYILFNEDAITDEANSVALAYVDSVDVRSGGTTIDDAVKICDHLVGRPTMVICSAYTDVVTAIAQVRALGSDVVEGAGVWNDAEVGLSDTTFLAASGSRNRIAFGEGASSPVGKIQLWDAATQNISSAVATRDLVNNASERVLGLGLNQDGELGVARGSVQAYFFDKNLRQQGVYGDQVAGGTGGAALHPLHTGFDGGSAATRLAFVATPNRTIRIIDTFHFNLRGEITIRDNVSGPLRVSLPLSGDNPLGLPAGHPDLIIIKLYVVTSAGGVAVINVRNRDVSP